MFDLPQAMNQKNQKNQNSTTSDPKCSKKNKKIFAIRLMELQSQKNSLNALSTCTTLMHTSCWSGTPVHLLTYVLLCLRLRGLLSRLPAAHKEIGEAQTC